MSFAERDTKHLAGFKQAIRDWTKLFLADPANIALDLRTTLLHEDLMELRRVRWFAMHTEPELEKLWLRYVERDVEDKEVKESLYDFVMTGTMYMLLNNPIADSDLTSFINHIASTISWPARAKLIPTHQREYMGGSEQFKTILEGNPWIIFLFLFSIVDHE